MIDRDTSRLAFVIMTITGILELRQYTLHPGGRDTLIALFEHEFLGPQEAVGAQVIGMFRDVDDPERFVWLRGFTDMQARAAALAAFYGGPTWAAHRNAANATMLDSDNVLLLRPHVPERAAFERLSGAGVGVYGLSLHYLDDVDPVAFAIFFTEAIAPALARDDLSIVTFATAVEPNTFPRSPVRERDIVFGWMARWSSERDMEETWRGVAQPAGWRERADPAILRALMRKPERLRLVPTHGSRMT